MAEGPDGRRLSEHAAAGTDQELCLDGRGGRQTPSLHCQETGGAYVVEYRYSRVYTYVLRTLSCEFSV